MDAVILQAIVDKEHRLIVNLPLEMPVGPVTVTIQPISAPDRESGEQIPLTREEMRQRLLTAGLLSTAHYAPEGAVELSEEERDRISRLFANDNRTAQDIINEDRGASN